MRRGARRGGSTPLPVAFSATAPAACPSTKQAHTQAPCPGRPRPADGAPPPPRPPPSAPPGRAQFPAPQQGHQRRFWIEAAPRVGAAGEAPRRRPHTPTQSAHATGACGLLDSPSPRSNRKQCLKRAEASIQPPKMRRACGLLDSPYPRSVSATTCGQVDKSLECDEAGRRYLCGRRPAGWTAAAGAGRAQPARRSQEHAWLHASHQPRGCP